MTNSTQESTVTIIFIIIYINSSFIRGECISIYAFSLTFADSSFHLALRINIIYLNTHCIWHIVIQSTDLQIYSGLDDFHSYDTTEPVKSLQHHHLLFVCTVWSVL